MSEREAVACGLGTLVGIRTTNGHRLLTFDMDDFSLAPLHTGDRVRIARADAALDALKKGEDRRGRTDIYWDLVRERDAAREEVERLRSESIPRERVDALVEAAYREGYEAGHLVDPDEKWLRIAWEESSVRAALDNLKGGEDE
jgi:hypothetical protein